MITPPLRTKRSNVFYRGIVAVRLLLSIHVAYLYAMFSSDNQQSKGGTFIEGTDHTINYLPYVTINDNDTFYQSLLFQGCLYPTYSGTAINYREELCHVTTTDYQSFVVSVHADKRRSDGTPVTLNDVYFTYQTLLKDNYRNIASLDTYRNIRVEVEGSTLKVIFPTPSVDNMIFFTNFLLPAHLLANKSLETYIDTFYKRPVGTNCAIIQPSADPSSIVFDLNTCDNTLLRFYQVKQFSTADELERYVTSNPTTLDMVISSNSVPGYTENQVILNKFVTVFFNTKRPQLTVALRKKLAASIFASLSGSSLSSTLIPDSYIFDSITALTAPLTPNDLTFLDADTQADVPQKTIPALPTTLSRGTSDQSQEYVLSTEIGDKLPLSMKFSDTYDRVSVSFNQGVEYFPESYNAETQSTFYNLNPLYRNVITGRNTYTIKAYKNNVHVNTHTLIIHYLSEPTSPTEENTIVERSLQPFSIVYFEDDTTTAVAEHLQKVFENLGVDDYFVFDKYSDVDAFEGKITSQDYDMVISTITMGLRRDLSSLFASSVPTINPSLYINEELTQNVNTYFLRTNEKRTEAKQRINSIFTADVPLVILGKELGSINIKQDLTFTYPFRLYVFGRRKDFLQDIVMFQHISIDRDAVSDTSNIKKFFQHHR